MYQMDLPNFNIKTIKWPQQVKMQLYRTHNRFKIIPQWSNYSTKTISKMSINFSLMNIRSTTMKKETYIPGAQEKWVN
jgi:hypothetical protein